MDDNGLLYLRARYYSPELGVFTALDPIENLNRYQYVDGNPVNRIDPSGLLSCFDATCQEIESEFMKVIMGWMSSGGWIPGIFDRVAEMITDKCCLYDLYLIARGITPSEPCNPDFSCFDADGYFTSTTWEGHQNMLTQLRESLDELLKCYQWRNSHKGRHDGPCLSNPNILGMAANAQQQTDNIPGIEPQRYGYAVAYNIWGSQSLAPAPQMTIDISINWSSILNHLCEEDVQLVLWLTTAAVATAYLTGIAGGAGIFDALKN